MSSMLGWFIRNPYKGAILAGIVIAILSGWVSFPRERTLDKTLDDWLPKNLVSAGTAREQLSRALESYREGIDEGLSKVSDGDFKELDLAQTHVETVATDNDSAFVIQYAGRQGEKVYVAERKVSPGPWWSPDRWLYKAVEAERDEFGDVLRLTFERDLSGLFALFLTNVVIGGVYAAILGMIFAVLGMETLDKKHAPKLLPNPSPLMPTGQRGPWRA